MDSVTIFVGLDYHQDAVQVCLLQQDGTCLANRSCPNDWKQIDAWVRRYGDRMEAGIEACSGAAHLAEELVSKGAWSVQLAHPGYVARMKQNPDKTDFGDARLLADLARVGYLPRVWLAPHQTRELRRLVRFRQQLVGERRNVKLRIRALLRDSRVKPPTSDRAWTRHWLLWLQQTEELSGESRWIMNRQLQRLEQLSMEIEDVEQRLITFCHDDPMVEKLQTFAGIGLITAVTLRAEIGRFDRFRSGKQLARFCGLSPRNASSGQRQADAGLIKAGNPQLRGVLLEAAHRLIRYEKRWTLLSNRMRTRGKPGSVVAAAVANRWMRWLYHQMQPTPAAA